jgi:phosphate-selective porin OprO/OprP
MTALTTPVMAANDAMLDLLKIMLENKQISQEQYELLVSAAKADGEAVEDVKVQLDAKTKNMPNITTDGKLLIESADGDWAFQPIGRIFWDTVWVDDDGVSIADGGIEESGTELRRARIGFEAKFAKYFKGKLELDFAESESPAWKDAWISYNNKNQWGKYWIKIGQHHVPFGHATVSSSKYMPLMRRPLFADGPQLSRNVGVAFRQESATENRWFFHTGFFLEPLPGDDDEVNTDSAGLEAIFVAARLGGTPVYQDKTHLLHIGGSFQWEQPNGDTFNRIDNALLTHLGDGDSIEADFGTDTNEVLAFDAELIGIWGPFHAVGEFVYWDVDDPDGDADLYAWAVDAGWFFTGESMVYKYGEFSGLSPKKPLGKGGWGAWQAAVRFENMDLDDGDDIDGGNAYVFTAGLNWYPVKNVRFMTNFGYLLDYNCEDTTTITFDGCNGVAANDTEPFAFSVRAQVYW